MAALSAPAFAQVVDPLARSPAGTEPPNTSKPTPSTEPATSTEPFTDQSSAAEPGGDPNTSTSEPPTSTTEPPLPDLGELLIPRPEVRRPQRAADRALVDDLQRATYSYTLSRLTLVTTKRQVEGTKAVLAPGPHATKGDAIGNEILELARAGGDDRPRRACAR